MRSACVVLGVMAALSGFFVAGVSSKRPCPGNSCRTTTAPTTTAAASCAAQVDETAAVQALVAGTTDGGTVTLQHRCYRIEGTLEFTGRTVTIDGNGATLESFNPPDDQRAVWRFWDSTVTVRDMTIVGSYTAGGTFTDGLQHAHAVDLRRSHATLTGLTMRDVAGDCVYFGLGSSGTLASSTCVGTSRNAVSVVSASNVTVSAVTTDRVGYDVFDVEPNAGTGVGSDNVAFTGNTAGSYGISVYSLVPNEPLSRQSFTGNTATTMRVTTADTAYRPQGVTVTDNTSVRPGSMQFDNIDGLSAARNTNVTVEENNCTGANT